MSSGSALSTVAADPPNDPESDAATGTTIATTSPPHTTALTPAQAANFAFWDSAFQDSKQELLAAARKRHIAAGFSESTAPTQLPESFQSPLWEAIKKARTSPDESNRLIAALVGQPYFIDSEDDEWQALCEWGSAAGLRILRDHGFKPTIEANGLALSESCRRNESVEESLEILRPLLDLTQCVVVNPWSSELTLTSVVALLYE